MVDNFIEMIAGSLDLKEPWYVAGAEFDPAAKEVHIYVEVRKSAAFVCPGCGRAAVRNGYEPKERVWRHGDCMFYPTYVHCKRPRVRCPCCGTKQMNAPFERKNSRFTLLFEGYAMLILADMPRAKAAEVLRCDEKSLVSILSFWVKDAVSKRSLADVRRLAVDETSRLRGHDYVTLVVDADQRRVIDVEPGKEKILAYFHHRITNAVCEGINSLVQAAKRKARGFNTFHGFASMIYLIAGKLQLAVPHPF